MNGRFLEDVQDNAGLAMQYFQEAERLDEAIVARNNAATSDAEGVAGVSGDVPSMTNIDEARDCVVVIDTEGVINFANSNVSQLFGYKRGELVGRNVSTLMPQPFSQQHDRFLKNYAITGQPHIINRVMPLVALHQNGTLFSITACITKISQVRERCSTACITKICQVRPPHTALQPRTQHRTPAHLRPPRSHHLQSSCPRPCLVPRSVPPLPRQVIC